MNIYTVADNLRKTIAGKEEYLSNAIKIRDEQDLTIEQATANYVTIQFLKININELKVILFDVEKCCEQATLDSWERNPDRSGGAFTDEEINRGNEWH